MVKGFAIRQGLLFSAVMILLFAGCGLFARRVKVDEEFTLRPGDRVVVAGTGLSIRLESVGHQWYVDGRGEAPYANLTVSGDGAPARSLTLGESVDVGDYAIKLVGANPFSSEGGPDCKLVVTRR